MRALIFLLMSGLLIACTTEQDEAVTVVDPVIQPYLDDFVAEGELRQYNPAFPVRELSILLEPIDGAAVGQCQRYDGGTRTVVIDRAYWMRSNTTQREFLVFHELGHCILGRNHLDDALQNGHCVSIMSSGVGGCVNVYNATTRDRYLDELFAQ